MLDNGKLIAEGTADELKRLIGGGHISLRFADASRLASAADAAAIEVDELTVHTPDLDDVFPALTDHSDLREQTLR